MGGAEWRKSGAYTQYVSILSWFAIHRYTIRSMKGAVYGQHRLGRLDFFEMGSNQL